MRAGLKIAVVLLGGLIAAFWVFAPREPAPLSIAHDRIAIGTDIDAYLAAREARFDDIIDGVEKTVYWAGPSNQRTRLALVYIHGFSATSQEIRPVPDRLAAALGANLFFTRLSGHGRGAEPMAQTSVSQWMQDIGEALEIGRQIGDSVIVIATSTGGTLAAAAALESANIEDVAGIIFVSPNFGINNRAANLLSWPLARHWVPLVLGDMRHSTPRNSRHAHYWTTSYPTTALMPMAALVNAVQQEDYTAVSMPALFYYSLADKVVDPDRTTAFAQRWGGPVRVVTAEMGPGDDSFAHVIAGDIVSPGQTDSAVAVMLDWIHSL